MCSVNAGSSPLLLENLCEQAVRFTHSCPDRYLTLSNGVDQHVGEDVVDLGIFDETEFGLGTGVANESHVQTCSGFLKARNVARYSGPLTCFQDSGGPPLSFQISLSMPNHFAY